MADWIGKTLGNYRIVEQIGRGGMATVYKAYQPALERYVAIKIIHEQLVAQDEQFFKRFQREAKGVATLRHPNIVQVFDFGVQDDVSYMVMEYLAGVSLKAELKRLHQKGGTIMPLEEAQRIFQAVANAVDYAYGQGIVHRDLKPDNVILTTKGNVILTDFGIAKIVGGTQYTVAGAVMGTPAYMSPEQGKGERGDERSDIYSLGVMLYEMVAGRVPFEADTPLAVIFKHISDPLPLPRKLNPAIPEKVEQVILKALAKNPEDRYQRAADMADAFANAMVVEAMSLDRETGVSETTTAEKIMRSGEPSVGAAPSSSVRSLHPEAPSHRPRRLVGISPWMWVVGGMAAGVLFVITGILVMDRIKSPPTTVTTAPVLIAMPTNTSTLTPMPTNTPTLTPMPTNTPQPPTSTPIRVSDTELLPTRIGFVSQRSGVDEIYVMDTNGSDLVKLATGIDPAWSPDGTKLAFGSPSGVILVMNADGTGLRELTNKDDWQPVWSPDGKQIAFVSSRSGTRQIYKMDNSGSNQIRLTNNAFHDRHPSWSPGGNKIAFISNRSGLWQIWVMNADGTDQTLLTNEPFDHFRPVWSPGSHKIAFGVWTGQRNEIWVMNADGTNPAPLMTDSIYKQEYTGYGLFWSPSNWIAFVSDQDGNPEIYAVQADGTDLVRITNDIAADYSPTWVPNFNRK